VSPKVGPVLKAQFKPETPTNVVSLGDVRKRTL
jgi:hypothetical protein